MHTAHSSVEVPEAPGIYFFYLTNISLVKVGLYRDQIASDDLLEQARENLIHRITQATKLFQKLTLEGKVSEPYRAQFFNNEFQVQLQQTPHLIGKQVRELPLKLLPRLVNFLESTNLVNRPIYVGQAQQQTLKARYDQHKGNFDANDPGTFGGRLREAGLDWDDITYSWLPVDAFLAENAEAVNFLEHSLLLTCNPVLSKR